MPQVPVLQRRREAYRRYCQLRDRGKLEGGNNPPLSAADLITPAVSRVHEHSAAALPAGTAGDGAAAWSGHGSDAPPPELAAAAEAAVPQNHVSQKHESAQGRQQARTLGGCFRGVLPTARWPGQHAVRGSVTGASLRGRGCGPQTSLGPACAPEAALRACQHLSYQACGVRTPCPTLA